MPHSQLLPRWFIVLLALVVYCSNLAGQSYVHQYRFDPDASLLNISGGFAYFDLDYQIRGTFGLVINQLPGQPTTFGISDVRARLVGEAPFHNLPLDSLLQMSLWQGTLSNPYTIDFTGRDNQHAPIKVAGTIGNVVLLLNGSNEPPCCDLFDYRLDAATHIVSLTPLVGAVANGNIALQGDSGTPSAETATLTANSVVPEPAAVWIVLGLYFTLKGSQTRKV